MFIPNPLQLKAMLVAGLLMALAIAALSAWALFERSRYFECRAGTVALAAQGAVLGDKLETLSGAVQDAAKKGQAAVAHTRQLLAEAQRLAAPRADVDASEKAARAPAPAGKGCTDAAAEIRAARKASESGRAR